MKRSEHEKSYQGGLVRQDAKEMAWESDSLIKSTRIGRAFADGDRNGMKSTTARKSKNQKNQTSDSLW